MEYSDNISRVIYTHKRKGEVVTVKEEKTQDEHLLLVNINRNGDISEAIHQITEHNFVFEVPLKEAPVGMLSRKIADYEGYVQKIFHEEMASHISPERFTVTARISWDSNKLDALVSNNDDMKMTASAVDIRLGSAISKLDVAVLIDQGLPERYDEFVKQLVLAHYLFRPARSDKLEVKRALFPSQNFLGSDFQSRLLAYEEEVRQRLNKALSQHIDEGSFEVSSRVFWDRQKLEGLKFQYQKNAKKKKSVQEIQPASIVEKLQVSVLLDRNLSKENNDFIQSLISAQKDFQKQRGDVVNVQRIIFPSKDSIGATHETKLEETLKNLLTNYISPKNFFVKVQLLPDKSDTKAGRPPIRVSVVLNDLLDPKIDEFVKQIVPFTLNTDTKSGDVVEINRKRFPESSNNSQISDHTLAGSATVEDIQDIFVQIKAYYGQMDYEKALSLTNQALMMVAEREQKVQLLKMKGSLYYLMQDSESAKRAWNEVLRIEPNDDEAKQSLSMMNS